MFVCKAFFFNYSLEIDSQKWNDCFQGYDILEILYKNSQKSV